MEIATVTLYKDGEKIIVNEQDAAAWTKAGWKPKPPAKKE